MAWPTSTYGQNNYTDYYASATSLPPGGSTTTGGGPPLGAISLLYDGSVVQFMQWAASTAAGNACTFTGSYINNQYQITPTTATIQWVSHINDRAGGTGLGVGNITLAANSFAWGTCNGISYPLSTATTAAFKFMCSSSTTGLLKTVTAGTDVGNNVYNLVLVGGSNAQSPSFISQ